MPRERPPLGEIATTRDGRDITRGYVDALPWLPPSDRVLRTAGGWRGYEELLRDDQVAATFAQRRLAVVSRPWEVEPGGERRIDRRAADLVRETLDRLDWDRITDQMLYARFFGFAVAEIIWETRADEVRIADIRVRDRERFAFAPDGALLLRTMARPQGEPVPPKKFWTVSVGASHHDEPYGRGLAHQLWWPVWFKRNGARFWAVYLEKFGMPTVLGRFPDGTSDAERDRLLDACMAIASDSGLVIPERMQIELLEAARSGSAGYEAWMGYWDRAIAKVVLGQTMTTEDGSSRAQAQVHMAVRQDIVAADADLVSGSANASWVRWLVGFNLPGAEPPRIWRDLSDPEDLEARARRDQIMAQIGWRLTPEAVHRVYGDDYEPAEARTEAAGASPVEAAERDDDPPTPPDLVAERVEREAQPIVDGWIDRIRGLVEQASTLEELRGLILEAFGDLPADELAELLAQALLAAELAGRSDAMDQSRA